MNCPEFYIYKNGYCLSCALIALSNEGIDKWYQDGKCVEKCDGDFAIYDNERFICLDCKERTNISGIIYCGCYEGTVKSEEDNICYLPEDESIKKLLLIRPNTQCYLRDGLTHNYCNQNNTFTCEIKSYSGYSFPNCICKKGYSGKYCEFVDNSEPDLNGNMDNILNKKDDIIEESNPSIIAKIRGIVFFLEKDNNNNYNYIKLIETTNIDLYISATIKTIRNDLNLNSARQQIYDIIELAVYFLKYKINIQRLRNLEDQDSRSQLNYILDNAHYLNYLINRQNNVNYNIQSDGLGLISFISYQKKFSKDESFLTYIKNITYISNIIGYINISNEAILDSNVLILTFFNGSLFDKEFEGVKVNFSTNNEIVDPNDLKNFYLYLYSSNIHFNFELANYYISKNIEIYNKYDKCFIEPCYFNTKFEFDLTQKYRKNNVFQKWSADNQYCKYHSFEEKSNTIELFYRDNYSYW